MHLRNRPLLILLVVVLVRGTIPFEAAQAQDEVVLSVAIPGFSEGFLTPEAFQPFEAETGVKVYLVSGGFPFFPSAADGIDAHLDAFAEYASSADVLFLMNTSSLSVEATRALPRRLLPCRVAVVPVGSRCVGGAGGARRDHAELRSRSV
jgi:hypothetical protein